MFVAAHTFRMRKPRCRVRTAVKLKLITPESKKSATSSLVLSGIAVKPGTATPDAVRLHRTVIRPASKPISGKMYFAATRTCR